MSKRREKKAEEEVYKGLPDYITSGLDILFIGINPGYVGAKNGHYYAGGNHFFKCLHQVGMLPEHVTSNDDFTLPHYGFGLTNMCERTTKGSKDLNQFELEEGSAILARKIRIFRPKIAVFNGKEIFRIFIGNKHFKFGRQPKKFENSELFVMPSTSARCSQLPRFQDKLPYFVALQKLYEFVRGNIPEPHDDELTFESNLKCPPKRPAANYEMNKEINEWDKLNMTKEVYEYLINNDDWYTMPDSSDTEDTESQPMQHHHLQYDQQSTDIKAMNNNYIDNDLNESSLIPQVSNFGFQYGLEQQSQFAIYRNDTQTCQFIDSQQQISSKQGKEGSVSEKMLVEDEARKGQNEEISGKSHTQKGENMFLSSKEHSQQRLGVEIESDDAFSDVKFDEFVVEVDPEDEAVMAKFMSPEPKASKTLADLIEDKLTQVDNEFTEVNVEIRDLDVRLVEIYKSVGHLLSMYTNGKLPEAFKMIPKMVNWEQILYLTQPCDWTVAALYHATEIFVSNSNERMCQRFYNLVLLPQIRNDIKQRQKLHFHLNRALRKSLCLPGAFFKGIILPLCESGTCTLLETGIIGSVISNCDISVLHMAAAMLKISQMDYYGTHSLFLRIMIDKKYNLPYQTIDGLVDHFLRFASDGRQMLVLWHQTLLSFVKKYKSELNSEQNNALLNLLKIHFHYQITPEICHHLQNTEIMPK